MFWTTTAIIPDIALYGRAHWILGVFASPYQHWVTAVYDRLLLRYLLRCTSEPRGTSHHVLTLCGCVARPHPLPHSSPLCSSGVLRKRRVFCVTCKKCWRGTEWTEKHLLLLTTSAGQQWFGSIQQIWKAREKDRGLLKTLKEDENISPTSVLHWVLW